MVTTRAAGIAFATARALRSTAAGPRAAGGRRCRSHPAPAAGSTSRASWNSRHAHGRRLRIRGGVAPDDHPELRDAAPAEGLVAVIAVAKAQRAVAVLGDERRPCQRVPDLGRHRRPPPLPAPRRLRILQVPLRTADARDRDERQAERPPPPPP